MGCAYRSSMADLLELAWSKEVETTVTIISCGYAALNVLLCLQNRYRPLSAVRRQLKVNRHPCRPFSLTSVQVSLVGVSSLVSDDNLI